MCCQAGWALDCWWADKICDNCVKINKSLKNGKDKNKSYFLLLLTRRSVFQKENQILKLAVQSGCMAQSVGCAPGSLTRWFSCRKLTRMDSVCWQRSPGVCPTSVHCQSQRHKVSLELSCSRGFFICVWIAWTADRDCGATSRAVNLSLPSRSLRICKTLL